MSFFDKIKEGLKKTKEAAGGQLNAVLANFRSVDEELLEDLEDAMIMADMGAELACEVTDELAAEVAEACDNAKELQDKLNAANERIKAMETAEKARRVLAAKAAAKAALASMNANRQAKAKFDESILTPINADIDAGKYTEKVNADGLWIGDKEVEMCVKAACADAQIEMDRKAREASESILATERFLNHNEDAPDGIDSLLSELDKI